MRKSRITQELANGFPEWTKIRSDDQSIGKSLLNVYALGAEDLFTELYRANQSFHLTTTNCSEIDQIQVFSLPSSFEFTLLNEGTLSEIQEIPTASGLLNTWIELVAIDNGSIKEFWNDALPTRIETVTTSSGLHFLCSGINTDPEFAILSSGLIFENRLNIEVDSDQLVNLVDNKIVRSKVRVTGLTWKDTLETEDIVFLYSENKQSFKSWKEIHKVEPIDFLNDATIEVKSHRFNQEYLIDSFEELSQTHDRRENFPVFWSLGTAPNGNSVLIASTYSAKKGIELLRFKPQMVEIRRWELLDVAGDPIVALDLAMVPFQQKVYVISATQLYVFDTYFDLPDLKELRLRTDNSLVDIEFSSDYIVQDEEIEILSLFQRPIKTIIKHRVTIKYPDGQEFGVLSDGTTVSTTTDYWVVDDRTERNIRPSMFIESNDYGQHTITLECLYLDQTTDIAQRSFIVSSKNALTSISLSGKVSSPVGIDVDDTNRLLILDGNSVAHHLSLHYDYCIWDVDNKELILREAYNEIKVIK